MTVRNLAGAGLAAFAAGGPLLLLGLPSGAVGVLGLVGLAALWLGLLLVLAAMVQLGRIEHRMLRAQGTTVGKLGETIGRLERDARATEVPPALLERLDSVEAGIDQRLGTHHKELARLVDARVLGIHATVRDLIDDGVGNTDGAP